MLSFDFAEDQQHGVQGQITKKTYYGQKHMKSPKNDISHHISLPHHGMSDGTGNKL